MLDMRSGLPETHASPLLPVERRHRRSRLRQGARLGFGSGGSHADYVGLNRKHHQFSGLSAAGNYNLFWVATSRYLDFRSDRHRELKQALEPCIRDANQNHANDLAWGTPGPICAPVVHGISERMQSNWQVSDRQLGELSREAILAHPMEVAYRFLWNLGDFLFVRWTVFRTADLDPLLFESNRARLRIDAAKAAAYFSSLEQS